MAPRYVLVPRPKAGQDVARATDRGSGCVDGFEIVFSEEGALLQKVERHQPNTAGRATPLPTRSRKRRSGSGHDTRRSEDAARAVQPARRLSENPRAQLFWLFVLTALLPGCTLQRRVGSIERTISWDSNDRLNLIKSVLSKTPAGQPRCARAEQELSQIRRQRPANPSHYALGGTLSNAEDWEGLKDLVETLADETCAPVLAEIEQDTQRLLTEAEETRALVASLMDKRARIAQRIAQVDEAFSPPPRQPLPTTDLPQESTNLKSALARREAATALRGTLALRLEPEEQALSSVKNDFMAARAKLELEIEACQAKESAWERTRLDRAEACKRALADFEATRPKTFNDHFAEAQAVEPYTFLSQWFGAAQPADNEFEAQQRKEAQAEFRVASSNKVFASKVLVPVPRFDFKRRRYRLALPAIIDTITPASEGVSEGLASMPGGSSGFDNTDYRYDWLYVDGILSGYGPVVASKRLPGRMRGGISDLARSRVGAPIDVRLDDLDMAREVREAGGLLLVTVWKPKRQLRSLVAKRFRHSRYEVMPYVQAEILAQQLHHPVTLQPLWTSQKVEEAAWSGPDYCPTPSGPDSSALRSFLGDRDRASVRPFLQRTSPLSTVFDSRRSEPEARQEASPGESPPVGTFGLSNRPDCVPAQRRLNQLGSRP